MKPIKKENKKGHSQREHLKMVLVLLVLFCTTFLTTSKAIEHGQTHVAIVGGFCTVIVTGLLLIAVGFGIRQAVLGRKQVGGISKIV